MALQSFPPEKEALGMIDTMEGWQEGDWVYLEDTEKIAVLLHFEPLFKSATCGPDFALQGIRQGHSGMPRMVPVVGLKRARVQTGRKFQFQGTDNHWHDIP